MITSRDDPSGACSHLSGAFPNTAKYANSGSDANSRVDSPSAFEAETSDIDDILCGAEHAACAVSSSSTMFRAGSHLIVRDIDNNCLGLLAGGGAAEHVALCRNGRVQVVAAVLEAGVHIWEVCASGDNLATILPCDASTVVSLAINETYVAVVTPTALAVTGYTTSNTWVRMPVAGCTLARFDGDVDSLLWLATTTGPRVVDVSMGAAVAAVVPSHAPNSPWSCPDTLADALAMCKRPVDIQAVAAARARKVMGPAVHLVDGNGGTAACATADKLHILRSCDGTHAVVDIVAEALSVCNNVFVGVLSTVCVFSTKGEVLREIFLFTFPRDIVATFYGVRILTHDTATTIVTERDREIYL